MPVALATDVNPGGGFSPSMPFAMTLACFGMDLTFEEALVAATINGAWSLDVGDRVGSLEPGKLADAVLVRGEAINLIRVGAPSISRRHQARPRRRATTRMLTTPSTDRRSMKLTEASVSGLLAAFRSSEPTPGGGSAAALAGAVGASLLAMVAGLAEAARDRTADLERLKDAGIRATALASRLESLIDETATPTPSRRGVQVAEGHRRGEGGAQRRDPGGADGRDRSPAEVMRPCAEALALGPAVIALGNQNATSDAQVGVGLLKAGLQGAGANVEINLGS